MSMLGSSLLNEIVKVKGVTKPEAILAELNKGVINSLGQLDSDANAQDGMDMSLCHFDKATNRLTVSGARNSIVSIGKEGLKEHKVSRIPVGGQSLGRKGGSPMNRIYKEEVIYCESRDCVFMFTDGFPDQVGGDEGKSFGKKRFRELLLQLSATDAGNQEQVLTSTLTKWRGDHAQLDDICILGFLV